MMLKIYLHLTLFLSFIASSQTFQISLQKSTLKKSADKKDASASCIFMNHPGSGSVAVEERTSKFNDISLNALPPPPCSTSDKNDDMWRNMRQNIPIWVQNTLMRDSGFVRFGCDTLTVFAVPSFLSTYRQALPNFLALTDVPIWLRRHLYSVFKLNNDHDNESLVRENTFESIQYGDHSMQVAHLMRPLLCEIDDTTHRREHRLVVFIHGGAWGSGRPWMYRLVARPLLQLNHSVAVIGYRTYPDTDVHGQVKDVKHAVGKILHKSPEFAENDVTIIGHSSGSHIGLLSILDENFLRSVTLGAFVSLSGVFDIVNHFKYEMGRGVEEISPLKGCCGGSEKTFMQCSPTYLVRDFVRKNGSSLLPKMLFLHGALDGIVPYTSTTELTDELHKGTIDQPSERQRFQTIIFPEVGHEDTIIQFMTGGEIRDHVLSWLSIETEFGGS